MKKEDLLMGKLMFFKTITVYQLEGYKKEKETYKHRNGIPECIVKLTEPIFNDLSDASFMNA